MSLQVEDQPEQDASEDQESGEGEPNARHEGLQEHGRLDSCVVWRTEHADGPELGLLRHGMYVVKAIPGGNKRGGTELSGFIGQHADCPAKSVLHAPGAAPNVVQPKKYYRKNRCYRRKKKENIYQKIV